LLKAIGDLQLRGLTPEEAFHIAVSRLEGQALPEDSYPKTEKQSVWWPRLSWMVGGLVVLDFIGATVGFLTEIPRLQGGDPPWLQTWWSSAMRLSVNMAWSFGVLAVLLALQTKPAAAAVGGKWLTRLGKGRRPVLLVGLLVLVECGLTVAKYERDVSQTSPPSQEALKAAARINRQFAPYSAAWYWAWHLSVVAALGVLWMRRRQALAARSSTLASPPETADSPVPAVMIQDWTNRFAAQEGVTREQARELGGHLQDSFEKLQSLGLSKTESWWLARRRVGSVEDLAEEMRLENPTAHWRERVVWILFGWTAIGTIYMIPVASSFLFSRRAGEPEWFPWRVLASMLPASIESVVLGLLLLSLVRKRNAGRPFLLPARDTMRVAGWFLVAVVCYFCAPWGGRRPLDHLVAGMMASPGTGRAFMARLQGWLYSPVPTSDGGVTGFLVWLLVSGTSRSLLKIALLYALMRRTRRGGLGPNRTPAARPAFSQT
jgi:hypothetical protein